LLNARNITPEIIYHNLFKKTRIFLNTLRWLPNWIVVLQKCYLIQKFWRWCQPDSNKPRFCFWNFVWLLLLSYSY
jgi:hypothetical protein